MDTSSNHILSVVKHINNVDNVDAQNNLDLNLYMNEIDTLGEDIYKKNDYLMYIYDIMENSKFNEFFQTHIHNISDVNTAMIYFNLFQMIKSQFEESFGRPIKKGEIIYMMKECMKNNFMRKAAIESSKQYTSLKKNVNKVLKDKHKKLLQIDLNQLDVDE